MNIWIQEYVINTPVAAFIFAITVITSLAAFRDPSLMNRFILHPWSFVRDKKYYTVVTSGLIHANTMHLGFNALAFIFFAFALENEMVLRQWDTMRDTDIASWIPPTLAHFKFLVVYVASMVLADLTTIYRQKDRPEYRSLGASGAVSGVVLSYIVFKPTVTIWMMPGWMFGLLFLAGSSFLARRGGRINHGAHFWGGATGFIFTLMFFPLQATIVWNEAARVFANLF